jgi:toxin ParE1/3/4
MDLEENRDHIARDSEKYTIAMVERVLAVVDRLPDFPLAGPSVPEYDDVNIRQWVVPPYRVIYRVGTQSVDVAAILHGARDLRRALAGRQV